jgi:hypothetical protein
MALESKQIGLRDRDRAVLLGANGTGKSFLGKQLVIDYASEILDRPPKTKGRILVVDTKPRWRPSHTITGTSTRYRYRHFIKGDTLDACLLDDWANFDAAFDPYTQNGMVVSQRLDLNASMAVAWQTAIIERFYRTQSGKRPGLIFIDECMDFFGPTGNGRYSDIVQKLVRAGREKGIASLLAAQRSKTINIQVLSECNVLYLFRLNFVKDVERLYEMGFPHDVLPPTEDRIFRVFRDRKMYPHPVTLAA